LAGAPLNDISTQELGSRGVAERPREWQDSATRHHRYSGGTGRRYRGPSRGNSRKSSNSSSGSLSDSSIMEVQTQETLPARQSRTVQEVHQRQRPDSELQNCGCKMKSQSSILQWLQTGATKANSENQTRDTTTMAADLANTETQPPTTQTEPGEQPSESSGDEDFASVVEDDLPPESSVWHGRLRRQLDTTHQDAMNTPRT